LLHLLITRKLPILKLIRLLKRELASEALRWVQKDLLSRDQAQNILKLYGTQLPEGDQSARGYHILMTLAALFMGLAFLVLVSANWEEIPRAVRMGGLIAFTAGANIMGIRAYSQERSSAGTIWLFLGSILYGTSIMLIAQIYHLGEHFPDGIYWWVLGVLPVALLTKSVVLMLMSQLLSFIWFFVETGFEIMPWSFVLLMVAALYFAFSLRNTALVFLAAIVGLNLWVSALFLWWMGRANGGFDSGFENGAFFMACGIATVVLGTAMEANASRQTLQTYGGVLRLWGMRVGVLVLLVATFEAPWKELFDEHFEHIEWLWISLALGVGTWLAVLALHFKRSLPNKELFGLAGMGLCIIFWAAAMITVAYFNGHSLGWQVAANLLAVLCGVAFIFEAVQETSTSSFYLGVGMLLLLALFRYFDLVGNFLGAAILFMVCAGVLMGAARFWRRFSAQAQDT